MVRSAGQGPPVLLLHGYPQTHVCWHRIGPKLAQTATVIAPDLPGYGDSVVALNGGVVESDAMFTKRSMAAALVGLMAELGHDRFHVVGHDRGGRVAYRMALDHPDIVRSLTVIDIMTTVDEWDAIDGPASIGTFHWPFLAQGRGLPEAMIRADPDRWVDHLLRDWTEDLSAITVDAGREYRRCFRRPEVIAGTCADYRAGAGPDLEQDRTDAEAGHGLTAQLLVLASAGRGDLGSAWTRWATADSDAPERTITSRVLPGGHFLPEENPDGVLDNLLPFLEQANR